MKKPLSKKFASSLSGSSIQTNFLETKPKVIDGRVNIDWQIALNGHVEKAEIVSSDLNDISLHRCIVDVINKIEFPPPPGNRPSYVFHKFAFKKKEESGEQQEN